MNDREYLEFLRPEMAEQERLLAELDAQIVDLGRRHTEVRKGLDDLRRLEKLVAARAGEVQPEATPTPGTRADAIEAVLGAADRPMQIREIVEATEANGQILPDDPKKRWQAVYNTLQQWKGTRFMRVGDNAWQLAASEHDEED